MRASSATCKTGRVRDVTVISGNVGTDPWALLSTNIDNDARRIGGTHYDWDTRLLSPGSSDGEVCLDMVFPYDFHQSSVNSLGLDQCTQRGFVFQQTVLSWRGTPGTASPFTDATVLTDTDVQSVDDFGRITSVAQFNDLFRSDDDLCTQTVYATPTGTNERVLSAPASRTTTSCATPTVPLVTYSKETWEYDTSPAGVKLPPGKVSNGFVTAHTVSRLNLDTGASLGDIRVFDATYDPATGRLSTLTRTRDDGARQKQTLAYDPFGLASVQRADRSDQRQRDDAAALADHHHPRSDHAQCAEHDRSERNPERQHVRRLQSRAALHGDPAGRHGRCAVVDELPRLRGRRNRRPAHRAEGVYRSGGAGQRRHSGRAHRHGVPRQARPSATHRGRAGRRLCEPDARHRRSLL